MKWLSTLTLILCSTALFAQQLSPSAELTLKHAKQLLTDGELTSAVILLESQLSNAQGHREYLDMLASAYQQQFRKLQQESKMPQAAAVWEKLQTLQPKLEKSPAATVAKQTPPTPAPSPDALQAAETAFSKGQFTEACQCFAQVEAQGRDLPADLREKYAYCKLRNVAERLNALQGNPGEHRPQLEREIRQALALAPRLEFGNELLRRLTPPVKAPRAINTPVRHLPSKDQGWSVCETKHFRIYHHDQQLAEQVAEKAETTRTAVINKWLGHDVAWSQPCQIFVHPTADSYHRQSGMPATAPGHSDYDADKHDASVIHYRRVFVRADHQHMLSAILPHEVTHVVLNGQFGRKLLPRWADEGMAVLSEPYSRIELILEPLARFYQEGRSISVQELLSAQEYPADRSRMGSFYGQSVCLVEYLTNLQGPRAFTNFMRDAGSMGEGAALQKHYRLNINQLDGELRDWIVSKQMPTLYRVAQGR
jgi:tetratricopeptide (TPR) repeat protein